MEPITREEFFLSRVADSGGVELEPITREEHFLARAAGLDGKVLDPITRKEHFLQAIIDGGGPGPSPSGTIAIGQNGTYDVAAFAEAEVNVEEPQGLVDLVVNYTDTNNRSLSAIVESNEVKNFTNNTAQLGLWIPLRKPFVLNTGDVITLGLSNVNNRGHFWDVNLIRSFGYVTQVLPTIPLIANQRIANGQTDVTYNSDPIPVFGVMVVCRAVGSGGNLKIGLAVNGETLF